MTVSCRVGSIHVYRLSRETDNREAEMDYPVATMGYLAGMYKAVIKPARGNNSSHARSQQLLKQVHLRAGFLFMCRQKCGKRELPS